MNNNTKVEFFDVEREDPIRSLITLKLSGDKFFQTQFDVGMDANRFAHNLMGFGRDIINELNKANAGGEK